MLVDLARNDLGRVAAPGSVAVSEFGAVERYSHVWHIVSTVTATVADGHDAFDVLRATFPAGTLTGAPKVRAMELIEELEPVRRGVYGGAVGYLDATGDLDMAIAIRTAVVRDGMAHVQAVGRHRRRQPARARGAGDPEQGPGGAAGHRHGRDAAPVRRRSAEASVPVTTSPDRRPPRREPADGSSRTRRGRRSGCRRRGIGGAGHGPGVVDGGRHPARPAGPGPPRRQRAHPATGRHRARRGRAGRGAGPARHPRRDPARRRCRPGPGRRGDGRGGRWPDCPRCRTPAGGSSSPTPGPVAGLANGRGDRRHGAPGRGSCWPRSAACSVAAGGSDDGAARRPVAGDVGALRVTGGRGPRRRRRSRRALRRCPGGLATRRRTRSRAPRRPGPVATARSRRGPDDRRERRATTRSHRSGTAGPSRRVTRAGSSVTCEPAAGQARAR